MIIDKVDLLRIVEAQQGFIVPHLVRPVEIMQGYSGPWSHFATEARLEFKESPRIINDDSYSIDFKVPFGTRVICSKKGVVEGVIKSRRFYEGLDFQEGIRTLPSFILISHGRFHSLYSHLGKFEEGIKMGVEVEQGQPIAVTGKTGWVGPIPHLHFEFYEEIRHGRLSHPVKFGDYDGGLEHSVLFTR